MTSEPGPAAAPGAKAPDARAIVPAKRFHLAHVDGLRALAALMVYVNHAYAQVWHPGLNHYPTGPLRVFSYSLVTGHLSVAVFIAVSGFCLALPVMSAGDRLSGGIAQFFKRRARRILPPYYGAVALCLLLIATVIGEPTGTLWDVPIAVNKVALISHLLLLQDLFGTSRINYVFWSIAVEWHIYLVFPLIVWSWRRFGPALTVACALLVGYAIAIAGMGTRVDRANPHFLGIFALGMLAAYLARKDSPGFERLRRSVPWLWLMIAGLCVVGGLIKYWGTTVAVERYFYLDLLMGVTAAAALVESSRAEPTRMTRWLGFKPLVVVGTFSYSLYLIHAPLLQLLWQFVLHPLGLGDDAMFAFYMSVGLLLILAASYGYFRVLEEPFMRQPAKVVRAVPEPRGNVV
jgi:peptidoglycan/LPS O-acetylase OafA/YrhL